MSDFIPGVRSTPEPRPEETSITTKPTAEEQMLENESLKNCTRAGVRADDEFDPDQIEDDDEFDDDEFDHCSHCDLPDACADFGCAIKQGLRLPETII